jgi:hypothetical protein
VKFSDYLLLGAFFLALLQCLAPVMGFYHPSIRFKWLKPIACSQFLLVTIAFLSLVFAFDHCNVLNPFIIKPFFFLFLFDA